MGWLRRTAAACALFLAVTLVGGSAFGEVVLLDFQTQWCGYCRMMAPVIQELAAEGYQVRTIDGDQHPELVRQYRVEGYPTFVALENGREVGRLAGKTSKAQLAALLQKGGATLPHLTEPADEGRTVRGQSPDRAPLAGRLFGRRQSQPRTALARINSGQEDEAARWEPAGGSAAPISPSANADNDRLVAVSVRLRVQDTSGQSTGSGTIIDCRDGEALILTCGHMFRDAQPSGRIIVELFAPGAPQQLSGKLISYDLNSDVALVRVATDYPLVAAKVAPASRCLVGDPVVSVGCDNGADPNARATHIVSIDRYQHAANLEVAFEPVQGRSGGGLFNSVGQVIGVCNAADAQDKQGLFAALAAIHAELDRTNLSFVYKDDELPAGSAELETQLSEVAATPAPAVRVPPPAVDVSATTTETLSTEEQALLHDLRNASGSEVICLVRSLDDPQAKSRVLQINRASAAFWRELAAGTSAPPLRRLTSLEEHRSLATVRPGIVEIATAGHEKPLRGSERADRIWPPRNPK